MVKIGLEVHCQLATKSKLFCHCTTKPSKKPNTNVCPICLGLPGAKPKVNKKAIKEGIKVALALNFKISRRMFFSRKVYPYVDLGKNFQITQYEIPLAVNGKVKIFVEGKPKIIRIRRVHLEEDPAKLIHVGGIRAARYCLADYNRSGFPLCEIVTEPDLSSPEEAREFINKLSSILEHLGVFDQDFCVMRTDANISLPGGERVEVKNISGFKAVERAMRFEIFRQRDILRSGGKISRETRHFNEKTGSTSLLRKKEVEEEYGYIFETDLPKFEITRKIINKIRKIMPELPDERVKRFLKQYKIPESRARVIIYTDKDLADFFESCMKKYKKPGLVSKWIVGDLLKCLNWNRIRITQSKVSIDGFLQLFSLIDKKVISPRIAKEVIKEYVEKGIKPKKIIKRGKAILLKRKEIIKKSVKKVLTKEKKAVQDYKKGKKRALEYLIGQVMKETKGTADQRVVRKLLKKLIKR